MKKIIVLLALIVFSHNPANAADDISLGDLVLSAAWSRASTGLKRPGSAFLSITNTGSADDRLIDAHTPAAARAELHNHTMDNGVMKMRRVQAVDVPAGGMAMLKPGSFHIMLFELTSMLKEGDIFPMNLTFEKAGKTTVMVHVGKVGAGKSHGHSTKHKSKHKQDMKSHGHMKHGSAPAQ